MLRQLIPILSTHFGTSLEHSFVHFPVFTHASIELKGIHTSFLEDVVHHAIFGVDVYGRLNGSRFLFLFLFNSMWYLFNYYSLRLLIRSLIFRCFLSLYRHLIYY